MRDDDTIGAVLEVAWRRLWGLAIDVFTKISEQSPSSQRAQLEQAGGMLLQAVGVLEAHIYAKPGVEGVDAGQVPAWTAARRERLAEVIGRTERFTTAHRGAADELLGQVVGALGELLAVLIPAEDPSA